MLPLQWPDLFYKPVPSSWLERLIPSYGNCAPITKLLHAQILMRPRPAPHVWGDDPLRIRIGLLLAKRLQAEYDWPNDHFLPEDPFDIAFLIPWDDLEIVEIIMELEEDLHIKIENAEAVSWSGKTLNDVVDTLAAKCRSRSFL